MKRCFLIVLLILFLIGCAAAPGTEVSDGAEMLVQEQSTVVEIENSEINFELKTDELMFTAYGQQEVIVDEQMLQLADVIWTSDDETVATVHQGVVTAIGRGTTAVTAQIADKTINCVVECDLPVQPVLNENAGERDPVYLAPTEEIVDDSFFDNALFISDSQGLIFYTCIKSEGLLSNAVHMARNSYSIESAADNKMLLSWRGGDFPIEEAIEKSEAARVFIMLGVNDVGNYALSEIPLLMDKWQNVLDKIKEKTPEVQICIQSVPPAWTGGETKQVTNEKLCRYNELLEQKAKENGCVFIDIAKYFVDSTGGMADCYASDNYVHTNREGVKTWVKVLKACTDYE